MRLYMMGFLSLVIWENLLSKAGFMTKSCMLVGMILMLVGSF